MELMTLIWFCSKKLLSMLPVLPELSVSQKEMFLFSVRKALEEKAFQELQLHSLKFQFLKYNQDQIILSISGEENLSLSC